ncbi:Rho GTPase-activating protein, partial [Massospora cicadina]
MRRESRAGTARRAFASQESQGWDEFGVAPLKTPSALELMQHVAHARPSYPICALFWLETFISSVSSGRVFKRPLAEATANSQIFGVPLPAVVLRASNILTTKDPWKLKSGLAAKQFFRELPETILTPRVLTEINHFLANARPPEGQLPQIRLLVRDIPDPNYYALHWLTRHLARVDQNSSTNKMNTSNLGMIFCPTLGITANLFRIFVTYNLLIFPLPKPRKIVVSSLPSESAHSSVNSLASLMKLKGIDPPSDSREAKNVLLFENIAALNELSQLIPHRQARHPDSAASTVHSRNSILSYQSNPRARRSRSIDSDTAQHLLTPATTTELPAEASAPAATLGEPILPLTVIPPQPNRGRAQRFRLERPRDAVWPSLAEVDLTKTRANLRPVNRSDLTSPIDLTLLRVLPSLVSFHRCIDAYL